MIWLTKKNGERFLFNYKNIERIDIAKDTIIILNDNDKKYIVDEKPDEIIQLIVEFEASIIKEARKK